MTRVRGIVVTLLVAGMAGGFGTAHAEREGSGSQSETRESSDTAAPFHGGEQVTLKGRIKDNWLIVTEGPHTGHRFDLNMSRTLAEHQQQATAGQVYEVTGVVALHEHAGGPEILTVDSWRLINAAAVPSTNSPYREGS